MFVLLYGPVEYHQLHRRCLNALISTVPAGRMDLRIGSNALCGESCGYVQELIDQGLVSKHYRHGTNDKKYPVMREMFYDESHPITTKWLLWFDDDSIADRDRAWLAKLAQLMIQNPDAAMFGAKYVWKMSPVQAAFFKTRPWYRGRHFQTFNGQPAPNGNCILFAPGGCWALTTEAMRACQIPDPELGHNGGDYTVGAALFQGGYTLKAWNGQKQFVHTSSVKRRGLSEKHFGMGG